MKKIISLLLLLCFALSLLPGAAAAEEEQPAFVIRSREDLEKLAVLCVLDTASLGLEVLLASDLDLEGREVSPIPLFAGHFDGQGHSIRGLKLTRAASVTGLFRQILPGAAVENLSVSGKVTPDGTAEQVGGLCGWNGGTLRNCSFAGTVAGSQALSSNPGDESRSPKPTVSERADARTSFQSAGSCFSVVVPQISHSSSSKGSPSAVASKTALT